MVCATPLIYHHHAEKKYTNQTNVTNNHYRAQQPPSSHNSHRHATATVEPQQPPSRAAAPVATVEPQQPSSRATATNTRSSHRCLASILTGLQSTTFVVACGRSSQRVAAASAASVHGAPSSQPPTKRSHHLGVVQATMFLPVSRSKAPSHFFAFLINSAKKSIWCGAHGYITFLNYFVGVPNNTTKEFLCHFSLFPAFLPCFCITKLR
ncbi:hypothetical protein SESBI_06637 [Sesbania bispinosa]|nr:hypothetical protein SESBI_06637 [Sesbania bispinosa]